VEEMDRVAKVGSEGVNAEIDVLESEIEAKIANERMVRYILLISWVVKYDFN